MSKSLCYQLISAVDRDGLTGSGQTLVFTMLREMMNLLHNLAILPVAGCLTLVWLYNPAKSLHRRKRSKILLTASGSSTVNELLEQTIKCIGYGFEKCNMIDCFPFRKLKHSCDITKSHIITLPSVSREFNPDILPSYFRLHAFKAHEGNDYGSLDNFLSNMTKPMMWCLSVEKYNALEIYNILARYSELLAAVNYGRLETIGFMAGKRTGGPRFEKHKDPLADEARRNINRQLSDNTGSALSFSIRTFAPSVRLAQLTAAVLAGSSLCDGTYDIHTDCVDQKQASEAVQSCQLLVPDIPLRTDCSETQKLYQKLKGLLNTVSAQELSGFFRLPIASDSFRPQTLACDTDPPAWSMDEILPFGYEVVGHV